MMSDLYESLGIFKLLLNYFIPIVQDLSQLDLLTETLPGHADVLRIGIAFLLLVEVAIKDVGFDGDDDGCVQVATGDHADSNASFIASLDGFLNIILQGLLQAIQGHHGHVLGKDVDLVIDFLQLIGGFKEGIEFLLRDVSVGSEDGFKAFLSEVLLYDTVNYRIFLVLVELINFTFLVQHGCAVLNQDFRSTLSEDPHNALGMDVDR